MRSQSRVPFHRSFLFNICFYLNTILHLLLYLPVLVMPRRGFILAARSWATVNHWLLRILCGIDFEIRGLDRIPAGPLLVATKHQSAWETYALIALFSDPAFILKRELMWLPVFGWYCLKARMIPVQRGARSMAMAAMTEHARGELADNRQIIIFPEGTRRAPNAEPAYKYGVAHLYSTLDVPCLPIALNSGLYWPRRSWHFRSGTIRVQILDPIQPGLKPKAFLTQLQTKIEKATSQLLAEGRAELGLSEPK